MTFISPPAPAYDDDAVWEACLDEADATDGDTLQQFFAPEILTDDNWEDYIVRYAQHLYDERGEMYVDED